MKKTQKTEVKGKYYCYMLIISLILIFMQTISVHCLNISTCLTAFLAELLTVVAAGMLPSVILAYYLDFLTTKHKRADYRKQLYERKKGLEQYFLDLTSEILVCINTPNYAEVGSATFDVWCKKFLLDDKHTKSDYSYFLQEIREAENRTKEYLGIINAFQSSIFEELRQEEVANAKNLIHTLKSFSLIDGQSEEFKIAIIDKLVESILQFFSPADKFPELNRFYMEAYTSADFISG